MDRKTRCILGWVVVWDRTPEAIQQMLYEVSQGKNDTYSVEADNAELRHYLARLARKSRCFSYCPYALHCALKLFTFSFNRRQLHKQMFPNYHAHVKDFINP